MLVKSSLLEKAKKLHLCMALVMATIYSFGFVSNASASPLDGSWTQVGNARADGGLFDGNCNLLLTGCSYGPTDGDFWRPFAGASQILFITGDRQFWGEASYSAVEALIVAAAGDYNPNLTWIDAGVNGSSIGAVTGNILMRTSFPEDPWVTLQGSHCALGCSQMLWGENNFGYSHYAGLAGAHGGIEVYARAASTVPAPNGLALLGLGLAGLGFSRRKKA